MKQIYTKVLAILFCGSLLTAECMSVNHATAEETQTGSVTVSVYDDETGNLIDSEIYMSISESTDALFNSIGHGFGVDGGNWFTSNENPYTLTGIEIKPGWFQMIDIITQNDDDYYYTINYDKSDTTFDLNESSEQDLSIYLTKTEKEWFLVYRGTYGEEQYPLFEYYYPSENSPTADKHIKVYYTSEIEEELTYGDILVIDEITPSTGRLPFTYQIQNTPVFTKIGNCTDIFDMEPLTITGIKYYDYASDSSLMEAYPEYAYTDHYTFTLMDDDGTNYSYSIDYYGVNSVVSLNSAKLGDTVLFAMRNDVPIIPVENPVHIPDIMGDVNEDREFTIADVVLFQKWLLCAPDTNLSDWKAADFCTDETLNAFDLTLMKRALLDEMKKPHCTMTVTTNYGGTGVMGQELASGTFTETFTISEGDTFYETDNGHWLKNANDILTYEGKIVTVETFDADGVTFTYIEYDDEKEATVSYETVSEIDSTFVIYDGINYDYTISFSDYMDLE